jgi:hypothetical protein
MLASSASETSKANVDTACEIMKRLALSAYAMLLRSSTGDKTLFYVMDELGTWMRQVEYHSSWVLRGNNVVCSNTRYLAGRPRCEHEMRALLRHVLRSELLCCVASA